MNRDDTNSSGGVARIAVCQSLCLPGDIEGNRHRIDVALDEAATHDAHIACFPEAAFLGWVNPHAHERAAPIPGQWSDWMADRAQATGLFIAIGLAEKENDRLYDSAILVAPDGRIVLKHRKINTLVHLMQPPYARGRTQDIQVVGTPFGDIGMLICADTFETRIVEAMARRNPDLLIVPYGWVAEPHKWPEHGQELVRVVRETAKTVGCPVIGTDSVGIIMHGPWAGRTLGGHSVVSDGDGNVLAIAKDRQPDVAVVEVPLPHGCV